MWLHLSDLYIICILALYTEYLYYAEIDTFTYLYFSGYLPGEPGLTGVPEVFYLHLFWKKIFGYKSLKLFPTFAGCISFLLATHQQRQNTKGNLKHKPNKWLLPVFLHRPMDSRENISVEGLVRYSVALSVVAQIMQPNTTPILQNNPSLLVMASVL